MRFDVNDPDVYNSHPDLLIDTFLREFKDRESNASTILKAIYFMYDPKSEFRRQGYTTEEREFEVYNYILGDLDVDLQQNFSDVIEYWMKYNLTSTQRLFVELESEVEGILELNSKWKWGKKDVQEKAKSLEVAKKLLQDYVEIKSLLFEEEEEAESYGNYQKSGLENIGQ